MRLRPLRLLPRRAFYRVVPELLRVVRPFERRFVEGFDPADPVRPPPVFLVGPPRSGSTVAYQLITNAFEVDYPSNLTALFHHSLYVGMAVQRAVFGARPHNSLRSEHGHTPGPLGPHQLPAFWYRWFPRLPEGVAPEEPPPESLVELRRTLGAVARRSGRPFVVKNLNNGERLPVLSRVLPEALVIHCRRDPLENAASILGGRRRVLGDENAWWGPAPRNVAELRRLPYPEQIVQQVYWLNRQIQEDLRLFPERQHMVLELADLRRDPAGVLLRLEAFFAANGVRVARRPGAVEPEVAGPARQTLPPADEAALRAAVEALDWSFAPGDAPPAAARPAVAP